MNKLVDNCSAGLLMWISLMIDNQMLFGMVDSCLAKRCVTASVSLRDLPRRNYTGNVISDANGNPLHPEFILSVPIKLGNPVLTLYVDLLVIDNLSYSCIIGQSILQQLSSWSVCTSIMNN